MAQITAIIEGKLRERFNKAEDYKFRCIMSLRSKSHALLVIPFVIFMLPEAMKFNSLEPAKLFFKAEQNLMS